MPTWKRVASHGWECGEWKISASKVRGEWVYLLWRGKEIVGRFESGEAAREACGVVQLRGG